MYDKQPIVNPARVKWPRKWRAVVTWMNAVRPYGWHWLEQHQVLTCAPGGAEDASVIVPPMRKISCWPERRRQEALYNTIKNPVKH